MLKYLRIISVVEGMSFLAILCVTLGIISREFVSYLGMFHGVLFMLYIALSFVVTKKKGWSILYWIVLFLASIVPFAFIIVELFLRKESTKQALSIA
ncbi:MAG: integral membrane protein [Cognaticolwellia sp.]|jgi:integral membrane protein